jgi:hypothetical protein
MRIFMQMGCRSSCVSGNSGAADSLALRHCLSSGEPSRSNTASLEMRVNADQSITVIDDNPVSETASRTLCRDVPREEATNWCPNRSGDVQAVMLASTTVPGRMKVSMTYVAAIIADVSCLIDGIAGKSRLAGYWINPTRLRLRCRRWGFGR